jgi:hypothetical protein
VSTGAFDPSPSSLMSKSSSHALYRRIETLSFICVQPSTTHTPKLQTPPLRTTRAHSFFSQLQGDISGVTLARLVKLRWEDSQAVSGLALVLTSSTCSNGPHPVNSRPTSSCSSSGTFAAATEAGRSHNVGPYDLISWSPSPSGLLTGGFLGGLRALLRSRCTNWVRHQVGYFISWGYLLLQYHCSL